VNAEQALSAHALVSGWSVFHYETFDYPEFAGPCSGMYVIATTHRSGSSWLCRELWRTSCLGAPHEYFNRLRGILPLATRFGAVDGAAYLNALIEHRTSPNGVFAIKALYGHWRVAKMMLESCSRIPNSIKFIFLDRRDKAAQAVSLARARQTQQWTSLGGLGSCAKYDAARIRRALMDLRGQRSRWLAEFKTSEVTPLVLTYEDLLADMSGCVEAIASHIGVDLSRERPLDLPLLVIQRDDNSADWLTRFKLEEAQFLAAFDDETD
ncbi:MAG: Stf0 family sulfotransferase, partial [Steroidobacteraceae bacterium]